MNPVMKGAVIYIFILVIFRFMGKKNLAETTTFDLVLLLIISETTSNALTGSDSSLTTCLLLVCTLAGLDFMLGKVKLKFPRLDKVIDGVPLILVEKGKPLPSRMNMAGVDEGDILEAARMSQGLAKMEEIRYAVLEKDGTISIIPEDQGVKKR